MLCLEGAFSHTVDLDAKLQEYAKVVSTRKSALLCIEQPVLIIVLIIYYISSIIIFIFELLHQFQMWLLCVESVFVTYLSLGEFFVVSLSYLIRKKLLFTIIFIFTFSEHRVHYQQFFRRK